MTIRFSAARGGTTPAIERALCPSAPLGAVNDNPRLNAASASPSQAVPIPPAPPPAEPEFPILPEALRHFARHGLSAALQARLKAEAANAAGDELAATRWLAICGQFDRRMAEATARAFKCAR